MGAAEFRDLCFQKTGGWGVDKVLITAETPSSDPVNLAAELARDRAIVVAVGTVGMELQRKLYYEKELDFRVSRSYGPGRYDAAFEQKGRDYPIGHVRWTETRNMEAFLEFISDGKLKLAPLITHRFALDDSKRAYEVISGKSGEAFLGVLIHYPAGEEGATRSVEIASLMAEKVALNARATAVMNGVGIGVLGAGNFAQNTLLPALKNIAGVSLVGVCNATGPRSLKVAEKFGFAYCTNSENEVLDDPKINAVVIGTRHHLHAKQTLAALNAGKAVFCEKPLCLNEEELSALVCVSAQGDSSSVPSSGASPLLMVGFNRRFAPMAQEMKKFLSGIHEPIAIHYRVNAGYIPADHWVHDPEQGGGRLLGEVCHFVDFVCFLAGACPVEVQTQGLGNSRQYAADNVLVTLKFASGTVGTISYLANGDRSASKERVEVLGGGAVAVLEDFRRLEMVRHGRKQIARTRWSTDKGHRAEMEAFVDAVKNGKPSPVAFEQIVGSTLATLRLQNSLQTGQALPVQLGEFVAAALEKGAQR
jgi:predicted dehydrogenase